MIPKYSADMTFVYTLHIDAATVVVTVAVHVVLFHDFHMMNIQWYFFFRTINTDKALRASYFAYEKSLFQKKERHLYNSPGQF